MLHVNVEIVELLKASGVVDFPSKCNFHIVTTLKYNTVIMHVLLKYTKDRERKETGNSAVQALVFIFHQLWWWYTVGS